jgi:tRNA pseudouridine55 synthase
MSGEEASLAAGLLVDKAQGITSHDVVAEIRRGRGVKVGHAGTLDPFATGLLVVLLGRATRLQRYLLGLPKTYRATARLGWRSSTGDPDGELTETGRVPDRLELPIGEIEQQVPMTSAVKVGGERLYRKAHRGEAVETPTRRVTIHRAELISADGESATFEVECSSGTYIRTLIETLGDAYCESLRRTAIDDIGVPEQSPHEVSVEELMGFLPERLLDAEEAEAVSHGHPVTEPFDLPPTHARLTHDGRLIAIARVEAETLKPEVVLA